MQEYEMAEVEARLLEAKVGAESQARREELAGAEKVGLAGTRHMGVPVGERGMAAPKDSKVPRQRTLKSVELFTGAGGLALGIEAAGFKHDVVVERDKYCCDTIRENRSRGFQALSGWRLFPGDVRQFDYSTVRGEIDLLAGGPPCQPFSIGGKHGAFNDERDMFPQVVRAVRELKPRAILVENVKGLTRKAFADYVSYIYLQLSHPEVVRKSHEDWTAHRGRLAKYHARNSKSGLAYHVLSPRAVNSATSHSASSTASKPASAAMSGWFPAPLSLSVTSLAANPAPSRPPKPAASAASRSAASAYTSPHERPCVAWRRR